MTGYRWGDKNKCKGNSVWYLIVPHTWTLETPDAVSGIIVGWEEKLTS